MKRLWIVCAAAGLVLAGLAGCSGGKTDAVAAGKEGGPIFQNLSFTWYINYDWYSAYKWANENEGEKWIQKNYGVNIQFLDAGGAANQKLATMLIDDEYPDVICIERDMNLRSLIEAGAALPLDDYLDKYPNLRRYVKDPTLNLLRAGDGKLYVFPNWAAPIGQLSGNTGYKVQKKYYEALGKPELDTLDDLYAYLKLLKEKYPALIPMEIGPMEAEGPCFTLGALYGAYGTEYPAYQSAKLYRDGNTIKGVLEDPVYRKTLLFANKLYRERLINQDTFTETEDQLKERVRNGQFGILCNKDIFNTTAVLTPDLDLKNEDPSFGLFTIAPPRADTSVPPEKVITCVTNNSGWNVNVITKNAKNPEAIFAFLDWLFGNEGQLTLVYGEPGKYWVPGAYNDDGYPLEMTDAYYAASSDEVDAIWSDANYVGNTAFVDNMARYIYEQTGTATQLKLDQFAYVFNHSVDGTELTDIVPPLNTDMGVLYQTINDIYTQAIPTIIMASSEERCNAAIDRYIEELKASNLQTLLDYQSKIIFENLRRLGK